MSNSTTRETPSMNPTRSRSIAWVADRRAETRTTPTRSRPRKSAPAPASRRPAPPGRGPSGYPAAACHHRVRDVHPPDRRRTIPACTEVIAQLHAARGPRRSPPPRPRVTRSTPAAPRLLRDPLHASHGAFTRVRPGHAGRGKRRPEDCLAAAHSWRWSSRTLPRFGRNRTSTSSGPRLPAGVVRAGRSRSCPSTLTPTTSMIKVGVLPSPPGSSRRSAVPRPRRTPAALRSTSPSAYTTGLC